MIILNPIPARINAPVDGDNLIKIQETIDNFFLETKNYLNKYFGENHLFELKSHEMELSDNKLTYLVYNDCCVAGVFERRTEFNNLEYIFFRDLTQLESKIKTGQ